SPGFTTVALISLILAIGAGTAIFSLVNAVLLRSLPVPNPHELRLLQWSGSITGMQALARHGDKSPWIESFSYPAICGLRDQCAAQGDVFGYAALHSVTARARHEAFTGSGLLVSGNFFSGLRARPFMGRLIAVEDDVPGAAPAVVISYRWWEAQFDQDP